MKFDFAGLPLSEAIPALAAATLVGMMIEPQKGLENVEKIATAPRIGAIDVGTNDLLVNMGLPGKCDAPEILAAQDRVNRACAAHGIVAGCGGNRSVERQAAAIKGGARFLTTQTDAAFSRARPRLGSSGCGPKKPRPAPPRPRSRPRTRSPKAAGAC